MTARDRWLRMMVLLSLTIGSMTLFVGVTLSSDSTHQVTGREPNLVSARTPESLSPVDQRIMGAATRHFQLSLEMKENVGFLLTPALLTQEVMPRDAVITYPSE